MKKKLVPTVFTTVVAALFALSSFAIKLKAQDNHFDDGFGHFDDGFGFGRPEFQGFVPGSIVVSGTVYAGNANTVVVGDVLPPGCQGPQASTNKSASYVATLLPADQTASTTTTTVTGINCGFASDNGEYPNAHDSHNVWNNANSDGSFGVSSPIVLWNVSTDGQLLGALHVPSNEIVTSFSSKSELALNRSADGKSLTFMGYRGGLGCPTLTLNTTTEVITQGTNVGPVSPTAANLLDVSASNTPGLCDPTNPAVASYIGATNPTAYYRSIAEVDSWGRIHYTDGDAYSGDNSRASIKASNSLYYTAGNDNNGNLSKKQVGDTILGFNLSHSTGAELFTPGASPLVPPANNMIAFFISISGDKPGKDTNFRGLTIFNDTLYVAKGSGGNGINTVYQLGTAGTLPTTANAPAGGLVNEPFAILPGFPNTAASTANPGGDYPFGIWFANATTLYVCDEGDLVYTSGQTINGQVNVADAGTLATAGLQKWVLTTVDGTSTWVRKYVIQEGLNLGVPYSVKDYPDSIEPATGGCRNIIGTVNPDGTATIYAITSTISQNGDNGADPNSVVKVTDVIDATTLPTSDGGHGRGPTYDVFQTIVEPHARVAYRGVALAPEPDFVPPFGW